VTDTLAYYLHDFSDETVPCDCTLDGWANWLSLPDLAWGRKEGARDGDVFTASVQSFQNDILATRCGLEWSFSYWPDRVDFLAVRFGEGMGWSADNIIWGHDMRAALLEWLKEAGEHAADVEFVAVARSEPAVSLIYTKSPPTLSIMGTDQ
jgi:hypothetical protein